MSFAFLICYADFAEWHDFPHEIFGNSVYFLPVKPCDNAVIYSATTRTVLQKESVLFVFHRPR
jgi:hypothetical protein